MPVSLMQPTCNGTRNRFAHECFYQHVRFRHGCSGSMVVGFERLFVSLQSYDKLHSCTPDLRA